MKLPRTFNDFPSAYSFFEDIPEERLLSNYEDDFAGENVWGTYFEFNYASGDYSKAHYRDVKRAGENWKEFCSESCHPALASPQLVNQWCETLLNRMSKTSARMNYLVYINHFYRYLMWNVEYPHSYNPVQFAVDSYSTVEKIWTSIPRE